MTDPLADQMEIESLRRRAEAAIAALEEFPSLVDRHLDLTGQTAAMFGRKVQTADFVRLLRSGRDFGLSTVLRALQQIRDGASPGDMS